MMDAMRPVTALPRVNPEFLLRPRLIDLLDQWSPVSVLLAPSGGGKAVLATQWAAHARTQGHDVLWVDGEVDGPDDVVAVLAAYADLPPSTDTRATLRRLRRALQRLPGRLAVVLNNAEPIIGAIGDELVEIVRDCRDVHLVACLRRRLDPVAKALLEAETRVVGLADLQFTNAEVRQLAALHGLELHEPEAAAIGDSVQGWAALLRTGLERLPDAQGHPVTTWSPRHVGWFLDVNVAPQLPPSAWAAIRRVSLVEEPVYGAVLAATGPLDDEAHVALEALGILDPLVSSGDPVVRLPPLMCAYFRERYDEAELGPSSTIHRAVVDHWLAQGHPARALHQAVAGRQWPLAVRIVEEHWWSLVLDDLAGLRDDLRQVPIGEVRERPLVDVGRHLVLPDDPRADSPTTRSWTVELLEAPDADLRERPPESAARATELLGLLILRELGDGDLGAALDLARRVDVVTAPLRRGAPGPVAPVVRRVALQAGTAWLLAGDLDRAVGELRTAVEGVEAPDAFAGDAAGRLALCAVLQGDRPETEDRLARWRALRPGGSAVVGDLAARIAAAGDAVQTLEPDDAELRALRRDVPVDSELWPHLWWVQAQHALAWGGRSRTRGELTRARERPAPHALSPWTHDLVATAEAEIWLSWGRIARAQRVLDDVAADSLPGALARARLARATGRRDEALLLLAPVLSVGHPFLHLRLDALAVAAWCHDGHDEPAARALLEDAVHIARHERLALPLSRVPREVLATYAGRVPHLGEILSMLDESRVRHLDVHEADLPALSRRETEVLGALARGLSLEQVARELFVSRNTVKTQTSALYRKLQVSDRHEAVRRAHQLGVLD